jgi:hypothetical protein
LTPLSRLSSQIKTLEKLWMVSDGWEVPADHSIYEIGIGELIVDVISIPVRLPAADCVSVLCDERKSLVTFKC